MPPKRKQRHGEIAADMCPHYTSSKKIKSAQPKAAQLTPISNNKRKHPGNDDIGSPTPAKKLRLKLNLTPPSSPEKREQVSVSEALLLKYLSSVETVSDAPVKKLKLKLNLSPEPQHAVRHEQTPAAGQASLKHLASDSTASPEPAKKVKLRLKLSPSPAPAVSRAHSTTRSKAPTTKFIASKSTLVPRGIRKKAILGQPDTSILRMVCDCSLTSKTTELHFRKIPHSTIDWNNPHHISKINAWRNQIYGRAGLKAKSVTVWHEMEELWFELYFQLSIVEARARGIMLPSSKTVRDKFNETFVGTMLQDKDGDDLEPRAARLGNAFASKFNRMCPVLRARLNQCVFGRSGDVFVPRITFKMMEVYKGLKDEMRAKGIEKESEYADDLAEWQRFLSRLGDVENVEVLEMTEEKEMEAKEEDAVAALLCLANSPVEITSF